MKKLVSLLAIGALSVGFAEDDTTDYLTGLPSSKIVVISYGGNDYLPDLEGLLEFWSKVNDELGKYLTKDDETYDSYAEAISVDNVSLKDAACEKLGEIMSTFPTEFDYIGVLGNYDFDLDDIIKGEELDYNGNVTKWKCDEF